MNISEAFDEIKQFAHYWNWVPDWGVAQQVYETIPESYSVLCPFAYSYLEELIRSTTSEYGIELVNPDGKERNRKVGFSLIQLAIEENTLKKPTYVKILKELKVYYVKSNRTDCGDNRHSVAHGYMHSRFWDKSSFEQLIIDIARVSKFAGF